MKRGTRKDLEATERKSVNVEFVDRDVFYTLREMSGTERDKFAVQAFKKDGNERVVDQMYLQARLVARCLVGENGEREYSDEEVEKLSDNVPASVLSILFQAAQKLNGLDAAAVEDAAKNSVSAPTVVSPSV